MSLQQYKVDFLTIADNQAIRSDCNSITFLNNGTGQVLINSSLVLKPNQSVTIAGNEGEIDKTIYYISFIGALNTMVVIRKTYI